MPRPDLCPISDHGLISSLPQRNKRNTDAPRIDASPGKSSYVVGDRHVHGAIQRSGTEKRVSHRVKVLRW